MDGMSNTLHASRPSKVLAEGSKVVRISRRNLMIVWSDGVVMKDTMQLARLVAVAWIAEIGEANP